MNTKNRSVNWRIASKKEVRTDFYQFEEFYNFDVKNKDISLVLSDIQDMGVTIESRSTSDIKTTKYSNLSNTILFYSKTNKEDVKELIRHFKNVVSHPENIKKGYIKGKKYYRIYDVKKSPPQKDSMKGVIAVDVWKLFSKELIKRINNNIRTKKQ